MSAERAGSVSDVWAAAHASGSWRV